MPHSNFVHLHGHTQYSLLDGACLIPNLLELAKRYKMDALAITDHGNMFGAIEFYQEAMAHGIKPIIGCEAYIAPDSRFEKASHGIQEASFHILLLAKDEEGYRNLLQLVTIGYLEGFYYRPRIDKEALAKHSKGLVCSTSCIHGEVPYLLLNNTYEKAKAAAGEFKDMFGKDNFYLEIQENGLAEQKLVNREMARLAKELDLPMLATCDYHYLFKEDAAAHDALLCIQTQSTLNDPNRLKFGSDEFYFKAQEEMASDFAEIPEALKNTVAVAEMCNLELDFKKIHLPHFAPPGGKAREEYLVELCEEGLKKRFSAPTDEVKSRLAYELGVIKQTGFASYFLIVWDFIRYAKEKNIPVGPGRGSAAGSLVSYLLGITDIDPLKYDLLFERFLNPDRINLPDIDIDFCFERRNEVIEYVVSKYGKDNVAQIITFGTMAAKAVIRDVGRVLGMPYPDVDKIAKLVPADLNITLKEALEKEPELATLYKSDARITQLIDIALVLEGLTRHASTHAAGVVISGEPLTNHVPLFKTSDDQVTTGYPMGSLEKIGLLKMDFLGLRTLTVIDETIKIVKRTQGLDIQINEIPLDERKTYDLLSSGETQGVFQLESSGMRDILKKLKPERFEDIVALLALYRPGPLGSGMIDDFIRRKRQEITVRYDHKLLEPILSDTYGIIVYQEQVMRIVNVLAGFSLAQADSLRRAMSKKTPEVMDELRHSFIEGAAKNRIDKKTAEKIFDLIEHFAGYGFNKSHSAAYAMISYRTAYLKANFPLEFMTALLTSEKDNTDKIVNYTQEAERMGITILPPDINASFSKFTVEGNAIRFGLLAVKNVGRLAIDSIVEGREKTKNKRYESLYQFCELNDLRLVNRKVIESLIKCGAFDTLRLFRSQLFAMLDRALEMGGALARDRERGQLSLFSAFEEHVAFNNGFQDIPKIKEWPEHQLLAGEKELLGFYITGHPLARYERLLKNYTSASTQDLAGKRDGESVSVGGIIVKLKNTVTKRTGDKMAVLVLEDLKGTVEVLVFPEAYKEAYKYLRQDALIFIRGKVSLREEEPKIIAAMVMPLEDVREKFTSAVIINIASSTAKDETLISLKSILESHRGQTPVYLALNAQDNNKTEVLVSKDCFISPSDNLFVEIEGLLGQGAVSLRVNNS